MAPRIYSLSKINDFCYCVNKMQYILIDLHLLAGIGPDNQTETSAYNCEYILIHQIKHLFCVFKRSVSLRRFF